MSALTRQDAGSLSLLRGGRGEPLVLLHPLALAGEVWTPLAGKLTAEFEVFAVDQRGHGASDWDGEPFTITDMAADLGPMLDALGLDSVHLLGMSMGGSVAMTFAGRHPERVRSLVLADTTAWYGADARTAWAERAERAATVARDKQLTFQVDRWFSEPFRASAPDEVNRVSAIFTRTDSAAHAAASVAMGQLDARELLAAITAPTLVLVGEQDYATPPVMAAALADAIPDATLRILTDLRHLSLVEQPDLADLVLRHATGS